MGFYSDVTSEYKPMGLISGGLQYSSSRYTEIWLFWDHRNMNGSSRNGFLQICSLWLIDWFIDWLVDWLIEWLIISSVESLIDINVRSPHMTWSNSDATYLKCKYIKLLYWVSNFFCTEPFYSMTNDRHTLPLNDENKYITTSPRLLYVTAFYMSRPFSITLDHVRRHIIIAQTVTDPYFYHHGIPSPPSPTNPLSHSISQIQLPIHLQRVMIQWANLENTCQEIVWLLAIG